MGPPHPGSNSSGSETRYNDTRYNAEKKLNVIKSKYEALKNQFDAQEALIKSRNSISRNSISMTPSDDTKPNKEPEVDPHQKASSSQRIASDIVLKKSLLTDNDHSLNEHRLPDHKLKHFRSVKNSY